MVARKNGPLPDEQVTTTVETEAAGFLILVGEPAIVDPRARKLAVAALNGGNVDTDLAVMRAPEATVAQAEAELLQVGMFGGNRCAWLRGFDTSLEREVDDLLELVERGVPAGACLLVTASAIDRRSRLYKAVKGLDGFEDLRIAVDRGGNLEEDSVHALVRAECRRAGLAEPSRAVLALVSERAGSNEGVLLGEIQKLCLAVAEGGALEVAQVRELMSDYAQAGVFGLTDALSRRDGPAAQAALDEMLDRGQFPLMICAALGTHVGALYEASRHLGLLSRRDLEGSPDRFTRSAWKSLPAEVRAGFSSPWRAFHQFQAAAAFGSTALAALHSRVLDLDSALKLSPLSERMLFAGFVSSACSR